MENITAVMVNAETDNGEVSLEHVEGNINGDVNNGRIYLQTSHLDTLETDNGNIDIETEKEPTNAILDIKTDNGKATVFGSTNWNTVVGDGDNLIELNTNNGEINVVK